MPDDVAAWIFQANPAHYDIRSAAAELPEIYWRVPQRAWQLATGDPVLVWEAGSEAGIVAVGRILQPPRETAPPPDESRFIVDGSVEGATVTRVRMAVESIPHIAKSAIAAISALAEHQIVTAPMGTVFPLDASEWSALTAAFPQLMSAQTLGDVDPHPALPEAFAWRDRRKSIHVLPGGYREYPPTLTGLLSQMVEMQPAREYYEGWLKHEYDVSMTYAKYVVDQLERISLVRKVEGGLRVTDHGTEWLRTQDPQFLVALLHSRTQLIGELMAYMSDPRTSDDIWNFANDAYDMRWATTTQTTRRRMWLQGFGMVTADADRRFQLSAEGRELLARLSIHDPPSRTEAPAPEQQPEVAGETDAAVSGRVADDAGSGEPAANAELASLVDELRQAGSATDDPTRLERAVADAFAFLGFDSTWLGGSGRTDVLLVAPLGRGTSYRVIIDCKTSARGSVSDAPVDWTTLQEHRLLHTADHVALVAPAWRGGRVRERAAREGAVLIETETLAALLRQHAAVPMGLGTYRALFEADEDEDGSDAISTAFGEEERWLVLAAQVVHAISELQETEGGLTARDLYWVLRESSDDEGSVYVEEEIERALAALAGPPIGVLQEAGGRYTTIGSIATAALRLRRLAALITSRGSGGASPESPE